MSHFPSYVVLLSGKIQREWNLDINNIGSETCVGVVLISQYQPQRDTADFTILIKILVMELA